MLALVPRQKTPLFFSAGNKKWRREREKKASDQKIQRDRNAEEQRTEQPKGINILYNHITCTAISTLLHILI